MRNKALRRGWNQRPKQSLLLRKFLNQSRRNFSLTKNWIKQHPSLQKTLSLTLIRISMKPSRIFWRICFLMRNKTTSLCWKSPSRIISLVM